MKHLSLLQNLYQDVRPYRSKYAVAILCTVLFVVLNIFEPYIYKIVIDAIVNGIANAGALDQIVGMVMRNLGIWFLIFVSATFFQAIGNYIIWNYGNHAHGDLTERLYAHILHFGVREHLNRKAGSVVKQLDNGIESYWHILNSILNDIFPAILSFLLVLFVTFSINWKMALSLLVVIPFFLITLWVGYVKAGPLQDAVGERWRNLFGYAFDAVANIFVVKSFTNEAFEKKRLMDVFRKLIQDQNKINNIWTWLRASDSFILLFGRLIVVGVGAYLALRGEITVGTVIMFLAFLNYIFSPLTVIAGNIRELQRRITDYRKGMELFTIPHEVRDRPGAKLLKRVKGMVVFDRVSFAYNQKEVLKDVSFSVEPGQKIALVGESGVGKTTIVSLLNRFYDTTKGTITIDGLAVTSIRQKSLRAHIGMVLQENTLFHDTIFNNLLYANPEASKAQIIRATKLANAYEFIMSLPEGFHTKVGERGVKLSGGEKQRIAIARVILKNPPIIVLDEATSSLDSRTEKEIQEALTHLTRGRTTIIIAHRLSTILEADQILVLEKGKVVDRGTHSELLVRGGLYERLWNIQVGGYLP